VDSEKNKQGQFEVVCSWCGVVIRSNARATSEQMCLICHARILNDYFQKLGRTDGAKQEKSRRRP
jgi:hypothetical protein